MFKILLLPILSFQSWIQWGPWFIVKKQITSSWLSQSASIVRRAVSMVRYQWIKIFYSIGSQSSWFQSIMPADPEVITPCLRAVAWWVAQYSPSWLGSRILRLRCPSLLQSLVQVEERTSYLAHLLWKSVLSMVWSYHQLFPLPSRSFAWKPTMNDHSQYAQHLLPLTSHGLIYHLYCWQMISQSWPWTGCSLVRWGI